MANVVPGTDVEVGKWYPAIQYPPDTRKFEEDKYTLLLGIQGLGVRSGFFTGDEENRYYWHCERYDDFDDEHIPGWTRTQEINNNLDEVYEVARGVSCWMIIEDFDNELPSYDGTNYYDPDPNEVYGTEDDEEDEDDSDDEGGNHVTPPFIPITPYA